MLHKILKTLVSSITIIVAVIYAIISGLNGTILQSEKMTLSLLILISTTFLVDSLGEDKKWSEIKKTIQETTGCQIIEFSSSYDWAAYMDNMVKRGQHTVDNASLDSTVRSKSPHGHGRIWQHLNNVAKKPNVKFRHIIRVRKNNFENLLQRIMCGSAKQNSFYAYYQLPQSFSFLTFGVIDNRYVSVRAPYNEGEQAKYIIIDNVQIAQLFSRWFEDLWANSEHISSIDKLNNLRADFANELTQEEAAAISELLDEIIKKGIMEDI